MRWDWIDSISDYQLIVGRDNQNKNGSSQIGYKKYKIFVKLIFIIKSKRRGLKSSLQLYAGLIRTAPLRRSIG
jgi:hypothetical protein